MMSLSFSRRRRVKCFGSYHDDFCILSVPWLCWLKQKSWLRIKCYYSRVNNILCKYCVKSGGQSGSVLLHVHEIPISVFWSAGSSYAFSQTSCTNHCLCKEESITFFLIIVKTKEKICEFHLGCCVCILPISLPGKKMVFFPN